MGYSLSYLDNLLAKIITAIFNLLNWWPGKETKEKAPARKLKKIKPNILTCMDFSRNDIYSEL